MATEPLSSNPLAGAALMRSKHADDFAVIAEHRGELDEHWDTVIDLYDSVREIERLTAELAASKSTIAKMLSSDANVTEARRIAGAAVETTTTRPGWTTRTTCPTCGITTDRTDSK